MGRHIWQPHGVSGIYQGKVINQSRSPNTSEEAPIVDMHWVYPITIAEHRGFRS